MSSRAKNILKYGVKLAVTVLLLFLVFRQTNRADLKEAFTQARWSMVLWVWLVNLLGFWLLSFNMHQILKRQDCHASTLALFATSSVTALYGLVLPGMLDSSVKWYILRRHTGKGTQVFSSMAYSQLAALFVTVFAALGALALTQPLGRRRISWICAVLMGVQVLVWFLLFYRHTGPKFIGVLRRIINHLPAWICNTGNRILDELRIFQSAPWFFHARVAAINFLVMTVLAAVIYVLAARAAWIQVPVGTLIWISALVYILSRLPISIANLGWREWTLTGLLGLYGADPSQVLVMSMVLLSNKFVVAAFGAGFQIHWSLTGSHDTVEADASSDAVPPPPDSCR